MRLMAACIAVDHLLLWPQVNRCVPCAKSGTFSLNASQDCQQCPPGGLCIEGLLVPQEGFFQPNPLVPQLFQCPMKGACEQRNRTCKAFTALLHTMLGPLAASHDGLAHCSSVVQSGRALLQALISSSNAHSTQPPMSGKLEDLNRGSALLAYQRLLAELMTNDSNPGSPLLLGVNYTRLMSAWHDLQCTPGCVL
jgi:hypothetical protein